MVKKYVITSMDDLGVLSRQAAKKTEREAIELEIQPGFYLGGGEGEFATYMKTLNQKTDIVSMHSFFWRRELVPLKFKALKKLTLLNESHGIEIPELIASLVNCPCLRHLSVSMVRRLEDDEKILILDGYALLLDKLASLGALLGLESLEINRARSRVPYDDWDRGLDDADVALLGKMQVYLDTNKGLKKFAINDQYFMQRTKRYHPALVTEFEALLEKNQGLTVEKLDVLQKALEKARREFQEVKKCSEQFATNTVLKKACDSTLLKIKNLLQSFLTLAEELIAKGEADAGFFLAEEIQLTNPARAYELLANITKESKFYAKANIKCAHILMNKDVEFEISNPKSETTPSMEHVTDTSVLASDDERDKMVILHLLQGGVEGHQDRVLLSSLLMDYVQDGKGVLDAAENPFKEMPFDDLLSAFLKQLDIIRETNRKLTDTESRLKKQLTVSLEQLKLASSNLNNSNDNNTQNVLTFSMNDKLRKAAEERARRTVEKTESSKEEVEQKKSVSKAENP